MADQHAQRDGDDRREDDGDDGVLQVLEDARGQAGRPAPVGRGEDERQRLLKEALRAHPVTALTRLGRAARVHGVNALPANMISVSMTTASTKIAMIPATIWSLLLA